MWQQTCQHRRCLFASRKAGAISLVLHLQLQPNGHWDCLTVLTAVLDRKMFHFSPFLVYSGAVQLNQAECIFKGVLCSSTLKFWHLSHFSSLHTIKTRHTHSFGSKKLIGEKILEIKQFCLGSMGRPFFPKYTFVLKRRLYAMNI